MSEGLNSKKFEMALLELSEIGTTSSGGEKQEIELEKEFDLAGGLEELSNSPEFEL